MLNKPFFTVVIPTFNRAVLIKETIQSFINQTYKNFEVIVVDDGGTDNSADVVARFNDVRIKYYWKVNGERAAARNFGTIKACGSYINYFDSDDIAYPNHLQVAKDTITKFNYPEILHLGYEYVHLDGKIIKKFNNYDGNEIAYAIKVKMISPISFFVRRDIAIEVPFVEDRALSASEDALHLCQLASRYKLYYSNTITSSLIQHTGRSMSTAAEAEIFQRMESLLKYLKDDEVFMKKYSSYIPDIQAEFFYMLTLACFEKRLFSRAKAYFKIYSKLTGYKVLSVRNVVFFKNYLSRYFTKKSLMI